MLMLYVTLDLWIVPALIVVAIVLGFLFQLVRGRTDHYDGPPTDEL